MSTNIKGVFAHLDCLLTGIDRLEKAGYDNMIVASPLPRHEIEEIMYKGKPSPVRWWTLIGGVIGACLAFVLFNGYTASTMGGTFSQVSFDFSVTTDLISRGILWSCLLGLIGGLFPAVSAARQPVTVALRGL